MGITKTQGFNQDIISVSEVFKVLGHPARLAILEYLVKQPECICGDIVDVIPLAQPTISRHLSELKRVGLIKGSIKGKNICYCIDENVFNKSLAILNQLIKGNTEGKCC